jgi:AraC family transcriptional regulator
MDSTASRLYADAMANALAVHLLVRYSTYQTPVSKPSGSLSEPQLKRVIDYIHSYMERDIRLADLANLTQLSSYLDSAKFLSRWMMKNKKGHSNHKVGGMPETG